MKKRILALLLAFCLFMGFALIPGSAAFTDISDPNVAVAAAVLEGMGIVNGVAPGQYSPGTGLTRAQFCALAVRAMGLEDKVGSHNYKTLFTDVKPGAWYTGYVNLAYAEGIVNGYGNGRFGPDDSITYGQAATLVLRMLGFTTAEIGKVWPLDYTRFADNLELSKGLSVTPYGVINRGQAAVLLYNTLKTELNGSQRLYYETTKDVASTEKVIILDNNTSNSGANELLMAYSIGAASASIEYYGQKNITSATLEGYIGTLLLNSAGKVLGFIPDSTVIADVKISSATSSTIVSASGQSYRISAGAPVIYNGSLYNYSTSGYLQVDAQTGRNARLFYDDNGAVRYVYMTGGVAAGSDSAVAETSSAESELARKLGITGTGYSITKNGFGASGKDIAQYDAAYYDRAAKTMRVSDYKISGYIESAYPSVIAAERLTVAGCELGVLESAWDTLAAFSLGDRLTLVLTDDGKVAAAYSSSKLSADMAGILSTDGKSVALVGSGLVLTAKDMYGEGSLRGSLVKINVLSKTEIRCTSVGSNSAKVDISANTVGEYAISPSCGIYEWAGGGYVYSLSGAVGASSRDFREISWTSSLNASQVTWYRLNSAGQVDLLLLKDATGNCYEYGKLKAYAGAEGVNIGTATMPVFNSATTMTNSNTPSESGKYICNTPKSGYGGLSMGGYSDIYRRAIAVELTKGGAVTTDSFFQIGDDWQAAVSGHEIPISENVQVYIEPTDRWYVGELGITTALSAGMKITVYYDRTPATGGQIRVIAVA